MRPIVFGLFALAMLAGAVGPASAAPRHRSNGDEAGGGSCGMYMYQRNGRCVDARNKPSGKSWSDEMLAKKWAG
jgi:hypothetical protein